MANQAFIKSRRLIKEAEVVTQLRLINESRFDNLFIVHTDSKHGITFRYNEDVIQKFYFEPRKLVMPWPSGAWHPYVHVVLKHRLAQHFAAKIGDESEPRQLNQPDPSNYPSLYRWVYREGRDQNWSAEEWSFIPNEVKNI